MPKTYETVIEAQKKGSKCKFQLPFEFQIPAPAVPTIPLPKIPPIPSVTFFCPLD